MKLVSRVAAASATFLLMGLLCAALASPMYAQQLAKRLIMKDGSYQLVSKWEVKGDRVRYLSAERNEWEEVPKSLVDWAATDKYEKERASGAAPPEVRELDKEEEADRARDEAATPQVAPGLRLPDFEGVFVLDSFQGQPQLIEVQQNSGELNRNMKGNILRAAINPIASSKQTIELKGPHAQIQAHSPQPTIFVKIPEDQETDPKFHSGQQQQPQRPTTTAQSSTAGPQQPQQPVQPQQPLLDPGQHFRLVRADPKKDSRVVGALKIAIYGKVSQQQNFVPTNAERMSGGWVKVTPLAELKPGEYALVEMLGPKEMNLFVWDFGLNASAPANPTAWKPQPATAKPVDQKPVLNQRNQ